MSPLKKVLFIDDNPVDRALIEKLLSKHGFQVWLSSTAQEGLGLAQERKPDLILLDVLLPGISGIEVCKKLKEDPQTKHIPVIFYTSMETPKHLIDYTSYGAVDYMQKTTPPDILIKQIKEILKVE